MLSESSELSYYSSDGDTRENSKKDVEKPEKEKVSPNYSDDFDNTSNKEPSIPASPAKSSHRSSSSGSGWSSSRSGSVPIAKTTTTVNITKEELHISPPKTGGDSHHELSSRHSSESRSGRSSKSSRSRSAKREDGDDAEEVIAKEDDLRAHAVKEEERAKSMSIVSEHDSVKGSSAAAMDELIHRYRKKGRTSHKKKRKTVAAKAATRPVSHKSCNESSAASLDKEVIVVNTPEDISNLLAQNDELRVKLLESGRIGKYSPSKRNPALDGTGCTQGRRHNHKTALAVQQALRREWTRQELRGEREYLISVRNELQRKVAANKRLHNYFSLIEDCKADIARLTEEKRILSLTIRQNERILIHNGEEQDSYAALRRVREEIKADSVLTSRALQRAQCEASEAARLQRDAERRVQKLEEKLAMVNNKEPGDAKNDPFVCGLIQTNQEKAEKIRELRKKLRRMKSKSPNKSRLPHSSNETNTKSVKHERDYLLKRIDRMRKKLEELSAQLNKQNSEDNGNGNVGFFLRDLPETDHSKAPQMQKHRSSSATHSRRVSKNEGRPELAVVKRFSRDLWTNEQAAAEVSSELKEEDGDTSGALEELKRRVEQVRRSKDEGATSEHRSSVQFADGKSNQRSHSVSTHEDAHSSSNQLNPPSFLGNEGGTPSEVRDKKKLESGSTEKLSNRSASKKDEVSAVPPWIDEEDGDEAVTANDRKGSSGSHLGGKEIVPESDGRMTGQHNNKGDNNVSVSDNIPENVSKKEQEEEYITSEANVTTEAPQVDTPTKSNSHMEAGLGNEESNVQEEERYEEEEHQEENEEYDDNYTESENEVDPDDVADADADAAPPAATGEPSWLDFD